MALEDIVDLGVNIASLKYGEYYRPSKILPSVESKQVFLSQSTNI